MGVGQRHLLESEENRMKDKSKLTKQEKKLLRRKLMQGGEFPVWGRTTRFNLLERVALDSAIRKVEERARTKKKARKE